MNECDNKYEATFDGKLRWQHRNQDVARELLMSSGSKYGALVTS